VTHVETAAAARDALREVIRPGDAVLVKGSNSVGLSALIESFSGGPSTALGTGNG
jgi:UDP-N-acetylmuramoyl-tripeptide--D-alanyl-D-alanine ligase